MSEKIVPAVIVKIEIKNEKNPVNVTLIFDNYIDYKRGLIKAIFLRNFLEFQRIAII